MASSPRRYQGNPPVRWTAQRSDSTRARHIRPGRGDRNRARPAVASLSPDSRSKNHDNPLSASPADHLSAALTSVILALSVAGAGSGAAATGADPDGDAVVKTDSGAVRGTAVAGIHTFLGVPYAAPPTGALRWRATGTCTQMAGRPRGDRVRPELPAAGWPLRTARRDERGLSLPQRVHARACSIVARAAVRCSCGSTAAVWRRTAPATTTRRNWRPRARWSSPSTTDWARSGSWPIPPWRRGRAARRATTGSWTSKPRCVGCSETSASSAATRATSPSPGSRPAACQCSRTSCHATREGCSSGRSCRAARSR